MPGQAARGSGALPGYVDVLIEMKWSDRPDDSDRRRRLPAIARFRATPRQLVIEWLADGSNYPSLGDLAAEAFAWHWQVLRGILATAPRKLNRKEIRRQWRPEPVPDPKTLYTWLEAAVARGLLRRDREGKRTRPFRYWLEERVAVWLEDPMTLLHMPELVMGEGERKSLLGER